MKISMEELLCEEPITKDQFKKIARFLDMTYPAKTKNDIPFLAEKETFDVWYELLKDNLYLPMRLGMKEYCLENKYPPAVSDIAEYTRKKSIRICEIKRIFRDNLENLSYTCISKDGKYLEITDEDKDIYLDFIFEEEVNDLSDYISRSNDLNCFASYVINKCDIEITSMQELIFLWRDYWKKRKNQL